jgi:hypothetical protein
MSVLVRSYKMENISIIENSLGEQFVVIDHGNDQFTSMPKSVWDELEAQREQSGTL